MKIEEPIGKDKCCNTCVHNEDAERCDRCISIFGVVGSEYSEKNEE